MFSNFSALHDYVMKHAKSSFHYRHCAYIMITVEKLQTLNIMISMGVIGYSISSIDVNPIVTNWPNWH